MRLHSGSKFDAESGGESLCCGTCYVSKLQKRICCFIVWLPVSVIILLLGIVLIKALTVTERFQRIKLSSDDTGALINPDNVTKLSWARKLGDAIKIPTVSRSETDQNTDDILKLHDYLKVEFVSVFNSTFVTAFYPNSLSILLRVQGSQSTSNPYLLCAHLDVVPAGDLSKWDLEPFLGRIVEQDDDQFIYGRGAIDDKHSVIGILQALELILKDGGQPSRTVYVAFGHDEEVSGLGGAGEIAKVLGNKLVENNEKLDFLLDEGMFVMKDVVPGVTDPVVYIGVVEKGWTTLELTVNGEQSHSSAPPRESTIGILANAVANLEKHRSPAKFSSGPEYDSMSYLAPHATFLYKMVFSNLWLFKDILSSVLAQSSEIDAIQRTTTAVTVIEGGFKENVMPSVAKAIVNHRIHPTEDLDDILKHDRNVIDDARVEIETKGYFAPPPISPYSNDIIPFQVIANSALEVFPEAHVTPGTLIANTDTKHYLHLTDKIYRFTPAFIGKNDTKRFHGFNERISVDNFAQVVEFYRRVIKNADSFREESFEASGEEVQSCDANDKECVLNDESKLDKDIEDYILIE